MEVAIDGHSIGLGRTGNETYVYNLVRHLALLEPNGERYDIYLNAGQNIEGVESNPSFRTTVIPTSIPHLRFGLYFPFESWRKAFGIFHSQFSVPPLLRCRSVLTIYDLAFERFPQFFPPRICAQMKVFMRWSSRRADHIITISESTKKDLVELYRVPPEKITVTYPGAADRFKPMDESAVGRRLRETYGLESPFVLYVGNLEPRKNLPRLLEAFAQLKAKGRIEHKLVLVGQKAWMYEGIFETIRKHGVDQEVVLTGYIPSEDLPVFYNGATVVVYPSIFEGFGLPVVEAMACGTPVITSLGSSLEEIAKDAAVLADPYSVSSIKFAMEEVLGDSALQHRLRQASVARAARFSFSKMAEQTRRIYQQMSN